jgi:hypothetical protein
LVVVALLAAASLAAHSKALQASSEPEGQAKLVSSLAGWTAYNRSAAGAEIPDLLALVAYMLALAVGTPALVAEPAVLVADTLALADEPVALVADTLVQATAQMEPETPDARSVVQIGSLGKSMYHTSDRRKHLTSVQNDSLDNTAVASPEDVHNQYRKYRPPRRASYTADSAIHRAAALA